MRVAKVYAGAILLMRGHHASVGGASRIAPNDRIHGIQEERGSWKYVRS